MSHWDAKSVSPGGQQQKLHPIQEFLIKQIHGNSFYDRALLLHDLARGKYLDCNLLPPR